MLTGNKIKTPDIQFDLATESVLKALLYYDIFQYPLTSEEVFKNLNTEHVTEAQVVEALHYLTSNHYIFKFDIFYTTQNNEQLIHRRLRGNEQAKQLLSRAQRTANFICSFPFVRSVMASGSLSKDYMDDKSDLDFFIITAPDRLWISRMLLVLYKKVFLSNSHKHFCINYFIDYNHLEIEEKNIFTATELSTLIPLSGNTYYHQLFQHNAWLKTFMPQHQLRSLPKDDSHKKHLGKKLLEAIFNFFGGKRLNILFMNITDRRWKKVYSKQYSSEDFTIAFKTKTYTSKNHPNHYQKKVVNSYHQKITAFAKQFNISGLHE